MLFAITNTAVLECMRLHDDTADVFDKKKRSFDDSFGYSLLEY